MTICNDYEKQQELEKKLFKLDKPDLIELIIDEKESLEEFSNLSDSELKDNLKNMEFNELMQITVNRINDKKLTKKLDKMKNPEINPIILENFPKEEPRELQLETISKIYEAIEKGYKFIILEAVSGFGKSIISATLSNIYSEGKSYILTTNNQLISQYKNDFEENEVAKINPRSSFSCKKSGGYCSAYLCIYDKCPYFKSSDFSKDFDSPLSCNYLFHLKESLKSTNLICTYDYFIQENFYHSEFMEPRKLLICDEGHNLDDKISRNVSFKISKKQMIEDLNMNYKQELRKIIQTEDYYYFLLKFKNAFEIKIKNMTPGSARFNKFNKKLNDLKSFMKFFDRSNSNLVFEIDEYKNWIFRPVKINKMIKNALLNLGEVCIFMSSSIFDHENFAYDLGIDENEIYSLRVPNIFDLTNNPIKIFDEFDMSGNPIETGMASKSLTAIKRILKIHNKEKGVIHTTNHDAARFIKNKIDNYRLITHTKDNREEVLEKFKKSKKPLVLVSPSMNEGVDLPGDLCRFQIIFKLPYLPFEDPWINGRKSIYEDGKNWYRYKMLTKLIQCHGRGIRFEGDYCKTYILDNRLYEVIYDDLENNEIIPKYFINTIEDFDG